MTKLLKSRLTILAVVLVGTLLLAACGNGTPETATPTTQALPSEVSAPDATVSPEFVPLEKPLKAPSEVPEELRIIWEVWALLTRDFVDRSTLDPETVAEAGIIGMLAALEDPHTHYIRPEAFNITSGDLAGKFEGIGANVTLRRDGKLIIVSPIEGGPADLAGIRPGDVVLEVNGESLEGLSLLESVMKIRGPRGSKVSLLIQQLGTVDPVLIEVARDVIPLVSVLLRSEPGDRIAHIRLTDFYADTAERLAEVIEEQVAAGAQGLIIDVRDNLGGLLSAVVDATSHFLDGGLVLYEIDGNGQRKNWNARRGGIATEIPIAVITNEFSASASEILAGSLQDRDRATIIGATTFGKGSVNILRKLSNDGGVSITVSRFFTPSGRIIEGNGLDPDIEVVSKDRQKAETLQLEKAIEELESKIGAKGSVSTSS